MSKKAEPIYNFGLEAVGKEYPLSQETIKEIADNVGLAFSSSAIQEIKEKVSMFKVRKDLTENGPRISNIKSALEEVRKRSYAFAEILGYNFNGHPKEMDSRTKQELAKFMKDIWERQEPAMNDAARIFHAADNALKMLPKDQGGRPHQDMRNWLIKDLKEIYKKEFKKKGSTYSESESRYKGKFLDFVHALLENLNDIGIEVSMDGHGTAIKNIK